MKTNLNKQQEGLVPSETKFQSGFTIIEVLIVLAIAGLIILIVFLAVPALQRNSRNTQRNNDASQALAAFNECVNSKNGQTSACTPAVMPQYLDTTKLRQLTTVNYVGGVPGDNATINIVTSQKCQPTGDAPTGASNRQFVALFRLETSSGVGGGAARCLEG